MRDVYVEDIESELFTAAFKKHFGDISTSLRNWQMLFRQMNAEKDTTKAIMRLDGDTIAGDFYRKHGYSASEVIVSKSGVIFTKKL